MFRRNLIFLLLSLMTIMAAAKPDAYSSYIEKYAPLAIEHRERFGIPASITLAQGLLESAAGRSTLAKKGNNHFGIKCHNSWTGDTLLRDDDEAGECFRAYASAEESFIDHSRFLNRGRYKPLHEIPVSDYAAWARGLKQCGYATDPNYAQRLIAIIERYSLQTYDTDGDFSSEVSEFIFRSLQASHPVCRNRGLHYIIANPGDTFSSIAREFSIPLDKLLSYNDVDSDGLIRDWEEVYLQPKLEDAPKGMKKITIGQDDTMRSISQKLGMKLASLRRLNPKSSGEHGSKLRLR